MAAHRMTPEKFQLFLESAIDENVDVGELAEELDELEELEELSLFLLRGITEPK